MKNLSKKILILPLILLGLAAISWLTYRQVLTLGIKSFLESQDNKIDFKIDTLDLGEAKLSKLRWKDQIEVDSATLTYNYLTLKESSIEKLELGDLNLNLLPGEEGRNTPQIPPLPFTSFKAKISQILDRGRNHLPFPLQVSGKSIEETLEFEKISGLGSLDLGKIKLEGVNLFAQGRFENVKEGIASKRFSLSLNFIKHPQIPFNTLAFDIDSFLLTKDKLSVKGKILMSMGGDKLEMKFSLQEHEGSISYKINIPELQKHSLLTLFLAEQNLKGEIQKGMLELEGSLNPPFPLEGEVTGFSLNMEGIRIGNLNFHFQFQDTINGESKGEQKLLVEEIDLGHPFSLSSSFSMKSFEELKFKELSLESSFGKYSAGPFPFYFDESKRVPPVKISVKEIPLQNIFDLVLKGDVQATGLADGEFNLISQGKNWLIQKGSFQSNSSGVIRYKAGEQSPLGSNQNISVNLLLDYLKDLQYTRLSLKTHSDRNYNALMKMQVLGKNPQVFEGRPLKFNLNLDFNILDMLKSILAISHISDSLKEKVYKGLTK